jgi:hypothetical protein
MLPEGDPQWSGYARHLSEGLVQLLQRFYSCKYEITDVNFIFCNMCVVSNRSGYRVSLKGCWAWIQSSRAIRRASEQQYVGRVGCRWKRFRTQTSRLSVCKKTPCTGRIAGPWGVWKNSSASTAEPRQQRCLPSWISSTAGCAAHRQHLQLLHLRALQQGVSTPPVQNETDTQVRTSIRHYSTLHYSTISVRAKLLISAFVFYLI